MESRQGKNPNSNPNPNPNPVLAARNMSTRQSCILGSSITKVRGIWSVEVLEPRLVTCKEWFRKWQNNLRKKYQISDAR